MGHLPVALMKIKGLPINWNVFVIFVCRHSGGDFFVINFKNKLSKNLKPCGI